MTTDTRKDVPNDAKIKFCDACDQRVLASLTSREEGIATCNILPRESWAGREISRSLQRLKKRGLVVMVSKRGGIARWRLQAT